MSGGGKGSHYPGEEKKAPGEEIVGERRAVLWANKFNTRGAKI